MTIRGFATVTQDTFLLLKGIYRQRTMTWRVVGQEYLVCPQTYAIVGFNIQDRYYWRENWPSQT